MSAMTKRADYERLAALLAPLWEQDAWMSEHDPKRWQQARDLDDALVAMREDDTVSIGTYRMKCLEMRALYDTKKGAAA